MNEIQKLDIVLEYLGSMYPQEFPIQHTEIATHLIQKYPELNKDSRFTEELYHILQKLILDGYVQLDLATDGKTKLYAIKFDGAYFINHRDGYQGLQNQKNHQAYLDKQRDRKVDALASFQRKQAVRLNYLTHWIVWATVLALLWELLKYFVFDHHWYFHPY